MRHESCWCKTITNLLLSINFCSNDCGLLMKGLLYAFQLNRGDLLTIFFEWIVLEFAGIALFTSWEKKGIACKITRVFTPVRVWCSSLNMWIELLFISFSATLRKSRRHFYYIKDGWVYSKIILFLHLCHIIVFLLNSYNKKCIIFFPTNSDLALVIPTLIHVISQILFSLSALILFLLLHMF